MNDDLDILGTDPLLEDPSDAADFVGAASLPGEPTDAAPGSGQRATPGLRQGLVDRLCYQVPKSGKPDAGKSNSGLSPQLLIGHRVVDRATS